LEPTIAISTPEIDARIEAQKKSLDALLQRFTEQHPDVLAARRLIRELEEQKKREVAELRRAAMATASPTAAPTSSLAYQELSRMLAAADVQVATMRARVSEYQARVAQARSRLKDAPRIEAESAQLNRDYAIHKKAYEDLVARRESATMSGNLENVSGLADFRLIDPPRVSPKPVAPNRFMLLAAALVAALAAGLAAAFAATQIWPVFHRSAELRDRFKLPLLGVVSLVMTDEDQRRERWDLVRFAAASGSLVILFAGGMAILAVTRGL
jgi:polysaccharide chain length determinant protein (PEP-CTERM system associated)